MINEPGVFYDMPSTVYFGDPCPDPSLTQSVAKILLERSPLHAWHAHPRLNPNFEANDDPKFDLGNVAHKLILGRGKDFVVLPFDDYRTKAAKEAREVAIANGKVAVLEHQHIRAVHMVRAARDQLFSRDLDYLFRTGCEAVLAWREGDIWLRQMIDWAHPDTTIVADYKTTDMSVAPHALPRLMIAGGWPIQAAMAERGLEALKGVARRRFLFVAQETEPPYQLSVAEMSRDAITMGAKQLIHAIDVWTRCMQAREWPGYPLLINTPEYPGWAEQQWLDREVKDAARERLPNFDPNVLMAG